MENDDASRIVNGWLWGDPTEVVCSRVYRWRWIAWPLILAIDWRATHCYGEPPAHCRRAREADRARRAVLPDEPDARLRMVMEA